MRSTLLATGVSAAKARVRVRAHMRHQLLGLSPFSVPEPRSFAAVRATQAELELEEVRASLRSSVGWKGLPDLYASDDDRQLSQSKNLPCAYPRRPRLAATAASFRGQSRSPQ